MESYNIGDMIKLYRSKKGLTQKELAEKSGLAIGTIQQYELGKRKPRLSALIAVANALEVPQLVDESAKMKAFAADYDESGIVGESIKQLSNDDPAFRNTIEENNKLNADTVKRLRQNREDYNNKHADLKNKRLSCTTIEEFSSVNDDMKRLDKELHDYITGWLPFISDEGRAHIADEIDDMLHNPDYTTDEYKEIMKQIKKKTE